MHEVVIFLSFCTWYKLNHKMKEMMKKIRVKTNHNKSAFQLLLYNIENIKKSCNI